MSARQERVVERARGESRRRAAWARRWRALLGALVAVCSAGGYSGAQAEPAVPWQASDGATTLAYSKDGRLLADAGSGVYVTIRDAATGALIRSIRDKSGINSVAFSPDGAILATGGDDKTAKLWRVSDGALLRTLAQGGRVRSLAFSPDGATLSVGDQIGAVKSWNVSNGALVRTAGGFANQVSQVAYSPDGTLLVASLPPSQPNGSSSTVAFTRACT